MGFYLLKDFLIRAVFIIGGLYLAYLAYDYMFGDDIAVDKIEEQQEANQDFTFNQLIDMYNVVLHGFAANKRCNYLSPEDKEELKVNRDKATTFVSKFIIRKSGSLWDYNRQLDVIMKHNEYKDCPENLKSNVEDALVTSRVMAAEVTKEKYSEWRGIR